MMENQATSINIQHVKQALKVIHLQGGNPMQIKIANDYLSNCQTIPFFASILTKIYSQTTDYQLQMSSILLLTNVIKRNWSNKRSFKQKTIINAQEKQYLRKQILQIYTLHDMVHYKHFNCLLSYLTRMDFPSDYPTLYNFVVSSLNQLLQMMKNNPEGVISNKIVLTFLSTCKVIIKQYHKKKIAHNEQIFISYIVNIIQVSVSLSQEITSKIAACMQLNDIGGMIKLFEYLRKIDKIIMHSIGCMPISYQYKSQMQNIVYNIFKKIAQLNHFLMNFKNNKNVSSQIQKYLQGILELITQTQNTYPLLFISFLTEYFQLILNMLLKYIPQNYYSNERLLITIIQANFKPFSCFAYYYTPQQFKESIYARKNSDVNIEDVQIRAHSIFKTVYNNTFVVEMLQTILSQVMTCQLVLQGHRQFDDQLVLQDIQIAIVEQFNEQTVYQNCKTLLKNLMKCFKSELQMIISDIIRNVLNLKNQRDRKSQQIISNAFEVILLLPYIYGSEELSSFQIGPIIQTAYQSQQFIFLSRIVRKYHPFLPQSIVSTAFSILARIMASPLSDIITPEIVYQSALGIKTLLAQLDNEMIPLKQLCPCIKNIVSLMNEKRFMATPPLMWPIINLLIRIMASIGNIDRAELQNNSSIIVNGISALLLSQQNEQLIVGAFSELLSTLIHSIFDFIKTQYPIQGKPYISNDKIISINPSCLIIFQATYLLIKNNVHNRSLDNNDTIYKLWLTLLRNYPSLYQQELYKINLNSLNTFLKDLFQKQYNNLMQDDPIICVQLLQEYYLNQLLPLHQNQLLTILNQCLNIEDAVQQNIRILMASLSLYYSYALHNKHIKEVIIIFFKILMKLVYKISPPINCLRTYLYLVVGHYLIYSNSFQFYNDLTNAHNGNFIEWFKPYVTGMEYVTNKFAFKLNAAAILQAISTMGISQYSQILTIKFENQLAIDWILKIISLELKQVKIAFTYNSYNNIFRTILPNQLNPCNCKPYHQEDVSFYKKVKFHLEDQKLVQIAKNNLQEPFRNIFNEIFKVLDWSSADIEQRVGQRNALELCQILGWQKKIV